MAIVIYPFYVQAGVFDVFSWVKSGFGANKTINNEVLSLSASDTIALKEEALAYPKQTIINMPLSQAVNSPEPKDNKTASDKSIIEGYAFTNENNSLDGSLNSEDNTSDQISLYTVRKGDTVPAIAKMFDVTPNTIYWANDLKAGSPIKPDQVIVILPITGIKYTVKKGDTVDLLAKKFKSDVGDIVSFNSVDTSVGLTIGQEIIIPNAEAETVVSSKTAKPKSGTPSKPSSNIAGYFKRPVNGGVRTQGVHGNNGVDLASFGGSKVPILAAADGTVIISKSGGWNGGYGNYVVIKHSNGTQTLYGHLSENSVSVGNRVSKGQQIGRMGSTGDSTGVHLHFEVRGGKNPF